MVRIKMESSNLDEIEYSSEKRELKVWFKNRKEEEYYLYSEVPPEVFSELMLANSKGGFFAKNIKNVYEFKKVEK